MAKSNHKHVYQKFLVLKHRGAPGDRDIYDVVNVCSICGKVKELSMKEHLVKVDGRYRWPIYLEELKECFGDLPSFDPQQE